MQKPKRQRLKIQQINPHYDLQPRMAIDHAVVEEYREAIQRGDQMPPVTVFFDQTYYYLVDGFHRLDATKAAGSGEIDAEIHLGDFRAAKLFSLGVNSSHGLKRSSADKRKACLEMLADAEWAAWSDSTIAKHLKVDHKTVAKYRDEAASSPGNSQVTEGEGVVSDVLAASVSGDQSRTYTTKHGTEAVMKTAKIGPQPTIRDQKKVVDEHDSAAEIAARTDATAIRPFSLPQSDEHSSSLPKKAPAPSPLELALAERDELRDQLSDLGQTARELELQVEAYRAGEIGEGEAKLLDANRRIGKLEAECRRLESIRDDWMNKHAEALKEIKRLKRQLERGHA